MADLSELAELERRRLRALSEPDLAAADPLHAADYQLITPLGIALSKEQYLDAIATGQLRYDVFEPVSDIRMIGDGDLAVLRYQARIVVGSQGSTGELACWHTDCWQRRDGRWQAVWSQATQIDATRA